jgi:hypothetical protein
MNKTRLSLALLALAGGAAIARAGAEFELNLNVSGPVIRSEPPPERVEYAPPSPGPDFVWIRGHWDWHRERWEWKPGRWERPAQRGSVWVPGRWIPRDGGWVWAEGHYAVQAPPPYHERYYVEEPPPPDVQEAIPQAPGPEYVWIRGHWDHRRGSWRWEPGRWEVGQPGSVWVPGQWVPEGRRWVFVEGHYDVQAAPPPPPAPAYTAVAPGEPPALVPETIPAPPPGEDIFWIPGHWTWNGGWIWIRGRYDRHPHYHRGGGWVAGRWEHRGGNFVWIEGSWR